MLLKHRTLMEFFIAASEKPIVVTNLYSEFMVEQMWEGVLHNDRYDGLKNLKPDNRAVGNTAE